jgi:GNAT superfamily N-acetyltransferase
MPNTIQTPANPIVAKQVQENLTTYFRLFAGLPGITFIEEDVTWIASHGVPGSMVLSTQLSSDEADQQIDETLRQIGDHTNAVDWFVFPGCQPADLGSRLVARADAGGPHGEWMLYGKIGGPGGTWMVADLTALPDSTPVPDNFHVKQVADQAMLDEWPKINARGFGASDYSSFHAAYARHGFGRHAQAVHFIGYMGDEPVTSSTLLVAGGSASVYNVSTPTDLRRRGFGGAITHAALQQAYERGYLSAWIWSSPLGKGVYAKLGFVVTDFGVREYQWKKHS